jgi:alpha-galactosidase
MVERANCAIALRSEGVSLVLDISNGQLPAILHWGADLGALELADVEAPILSNIAPGAPNTVSASQPNPAASSCSRRSGHPS